MNVVCAKIPMDRVFMPVVTDGKFSWEGFKPGHHALVVMQEVDLSKMHPGTWKLALEGALFSTDVKHQTAIRIAVQVPIIVTTNYDPPEDKAIRSRLVIATNL